MEPRENDDERDLWHDGAARRPDPDTQRVAGLVRACWNAFVEWRTRRALQGVLRGLSDAELMDIGTTRGEIDYVAANRATDPRSVLSSQ